MESSLNITQDSDPTLNKRVDAAVEAGIDYLYEHQYPNGEFCTYLSPDDSMQEWCFPESNVFCTSVIGGCLLKISGDSRVDKILSQAGKFLQYQMMRFGVWNFFTKFSILFKFTPPDVDTTTYTSALLETLGFEFPNNKQLLLSNTNDKGLFYTWIVWRLQFKAVNLSYLKIFARELKRPLKTITFWLKHEVSRNDVDAVVNANALYYFGLTDSTANIIPYLIDALNYAKEDVSDKWYKNPIVFYYFISRNYPLIKELEPIKPLITTRLLAKQNADGSFGQSDLENGMAIATLLNLNFTGEELDRGAVSLLETQTKQGFWKRARLFYCGPSRKTGWGSEETTTAFCLEALAMYRDQHNLNVEN